MLKKSSTLKPKNLKNNTLQPKEKTKGNNGMDFMFQPKNDLDEIIDAELKKEEAIAQKEREKKAAEK